MSGDGRSGSSAERDAVVAALIQLADDPRDWATNCCVCGSTEIVVRGVSIATSTNPDGLLVTGAWCALPECQEDRRGTRAILQEVPRG